MAISPARDTRLHGLAGRELPPGGRGDPSLSEGKEFEVMRHAWRLTAFSTSLLIPAVAGAQGAVPVVSCSRSTGALAYACQVTLRGVTLGRRTPLKLKQGGALFDDVQNGSPRGS